MHNELCERLGIEFPIFAFTHCRDVAAAVTNTGGMGVLGAVGFSADELEVELTWLDEHVGDRPYGVDIVIPGKYEGMGELDPVKLEAELRAMIPDEHRTFAKKILADHGVPELEGGPDASCSAGRPPRRRRWSTSSCATTRSSWSPMHWGRRPTTSSRRSTTTGCSSPRWPARSSTR